MLKTEIFEEGFGSCLDRHAELEGGHSRTPYQQTA
jgi:hypothetical protein